MNLKGLRRDFTRSVKQNKWGLGFLIGYAIVFGTIGRIFLDLNLERDRIWFQGFIALGVAFFIFLQFNLDYRNRRRNILYEKQIDALMEFHSIVKDLISTMEIGSIEDRSAIDSLKVVFQRYDKFTNLGKDQFIRNIAIRSPKMTRESLEQRILRFHSLLSFFRKTGYDPVEVFDQNRKIPTWEVIS